MVLKCIFIDDLSGVFFEFIFYVVFVVILFVVMIGFFIVCIILKCMFKLKRLNDYSIYIENFMLLVIVFGNNLYYFLNVIVVVEFELILLIYKMIIFG